MLENVQRKITKLIFYRCFKHIYQTTPKYDKRLKVLNLESLETRFLANDLTLLHNILNGNMLLNQKNMPKINIQNRISIRNPRIKFNVSLPKSKLRLNSFLFRVTNIYSKLPPEFLHLSVKCFRSI